MPHPLHLDLYLLGVYYLHYDMVADRFGRFWAARLYMYTFTTFCLLTHHCYHTAVTFVMG